MQPTILIPEATSEHLYKGNKEIGTAPSLAILLILKPCWETGRNAILIEKLGYEN